MPVEDSFEQTEEVDDIASVSLRFGTCDVLRLAIDLVTGKAAVFVVDALVEPREHGTRKALEDLARIVLKDSRCRIFQFKMSKTSRKPTRERERERRERERELNSRETHLS